MSSIRKTKKAMKKSNGFFSVVVDNGNDKLKLWQGNIHIIEKTVIVS